MRSSLLVSAGVGVIVFVASMVLMVTVLEALQNLWIVASALLFGVAIFGALLVVDVLTTPRG